MIYIVTYEDRYLPILKQSCPDLIILGDGDKQKSVVDFCLTKNPDDVICVIDSFDTIFLSKKEELLAKYLELKSNLVFSKGNISSIFEKYINDKLFGSCNSKKISAGIYIGLSKSIIEFWDNLVSGEDDQTYATKRCRVDDNMTIDSNNRLFYNYSSIDNIDYPEKGRIMVGGQMPCVIRATGSSDIKHVLENIGYTKTYIWKFIPEIIFFFLVVIIFIKIENKILATFITIITFLEMIHYELYVKHKDVFILNKVTYMLIDIFHITFTFFLFYFIFYMYLHLDCDLKKLLLLNSIFIALILLFLITKMCVLTVIENKLLGVDPKTGFIPHYNRLYYFFDVDYLYSPQIGDNTNKWMNGNITSYSLLLILNLYCIYKIFVAKKLHILRKKIKY